MILGQIVQGPWAGSGLGFAQGTDFSCNSTICFGVTKAGEQAPGSVAQSFIKLQRAINRWSGKAKFTSIAEDGKIGAATVTAMQKAGNAALDVLPLGVKDVAKQIFGSSLTKENVAANAAELTTSLNTAADKLEAQGGLPAPIVSVPAVVLPNNSGGGATSIPVTPPSSPSSGSGTVWWLLGGFAVVATAGIATAVVMKRRKKGPASKGRRASGAHAHAY